MSTVWGFGTTMVANFAAGFLVILMQIFAGAGATGSIIYGTAFAGQRTGTNF
jgi:hypothetical protein